MNNENHALMVMDLQEAVVGKKHAKFFTYDCDLLLCNANRWISEYPSDHVYYIRTVLKKNLINRFSPVKVFDGSPEADLAAELDVVNDKNFIKYVGNAFTNQALLEDLRASGITHVDIVLIPS